MMIYVFDFVCVPIILHANVICVWMFDFLVCLVFWHDVFCIWMCIANMCFFYKKKNMVATLLYKKQKNIKIIACNFDELRLLSMNID